jgi:formylglycine-generating enzyme required for sulfatase activity
VLRGGAWDYGGAYYFRAANRGLYDVTDDNDYVGFRCARTPPAAQ